MKGPSRFNWPALGKSILKRLRLILISDQSTIQWANTKKLLSTIKNPWEFNWLPLGNSILKRLLPWLRLV